MNVHTSVGKKKIWNMAASDLTKFVQHRDALLEDIISVRRRGLGPATFDAGALLGDLVYLADWYFWRVRRKQETTPNAARARLLGRLAKALGRALDLTKNDDVNFDLFRALHEAANGPLTSGAYPNTEPSAVSRTLDENNKAMAGLLALEAAARRAAVNVPRQDGRPKGTSVLPPEYIVRLAMLFRSSTGTKPGAAEGPFARFVSAFLDAVGGTIAESSVIDAIKDARAQSLQQPSGWPSSPFK